MTDDDTFDELTRPMRLEEEAQLRRRIDSARMVQMRADLASLIQSYAATPSTNQFEVLREAVHILYGIGLHNFERLDASLREMQLSKEERDRVMNEARLDLGEDLIRAFYGTRGPNRK